MRASHRWSILPASTLICCRASNHAWPPAPPAGCSMSWPLGGDAQIAELVLDGACQKVIFFEDPHVARQHEADIQLMERAVWSAGARCSCLNSPAMAAQWAQAVERVDFSCPDAS